MGSTSRSVETALAAALIFLTACGETSDLAEETREVGVARPDAAADAARLADALNLWDFGAPDAARFLDGAPDLDAAPAPDAAPVCDPAAPPACAPGEPDVVRGCSPDGRTILDTVCPEGEICQEGVCAVPGLDCKRGQRACLPDGTPAECEAGAGWRPVAACAGDTRCFRGECLGAECADAAERRAYLACDYWPVDLPSLRYAGPGEAHPDAPLGVILVNPDADRPVRVWAYGPDGEIGTLVSSYLMTPPRGDANIPADLYQDVNMRSQVHASDGTVLVGGLERADGVEVPPGGMLRLLLPRSAPAGRESGVARSAWHVRSDRPMGAYQFSPLCCNYSFSNDASLLLPASTLGEAYRFLGVPSQGGATQAMTIVALTDDTEVRLRFPDDSVVADDPAGRLEVTERESVLRLDAHEVLTVQAGFGPLTASQRDLTGAEVRSTMPVAVFSSHQCARYPDGAPACDHLEEQLLPAGTWGRGFVLTPPAPRGRPAPPTEGTWWRLLADRDETLVTFGVPFAELTPLPPGNRGTPACADRLVDDRTVRLGSGESCEVGTRAAVRVDATAPLLVAGVFGGQGTTGIASPYGAQAGDPSLFVVPPARQYRTSYAFLTPSTYARNFATLVVEPGAELTLDGRPVPLDAAQPVPGDVRVFLHVDVRRGAHRITGSRPFGIVLYAYDDFVSYAFTGGLDLRKE